MASIVIDHLLCTRNGTSGSVVAFIYSHYLRRKEQNTEVLLSSLLRQIAEVPPVGNILNSIKALFDKCEKEKEDNQSKRSPICFQVSPRAAVDFS
jgi:hypothetical protein